MCVCVFVCSCVVNLPTLNNSQVNLLYFVLQRKCPYNFCQLAYYEPHYTANIFFDASGKIRRNYSCLYSQQCVYIIITHYKAYQN